MGCRLQLKYDVFFQKQLVFYTILKFRLHLLACADKKPTLTLLWINQFFLILQNRVANCCLLLNRNKPLSPEPIQ